MPDFCLEMTGAPHFREKIFLRNAPPGFGIGPRLLLELSILSHHRISLIVFSVLGACVQLRFLIDPSRIAWNARLALARFASRLARSRALTLSVCRSDCCLAFVVLATKRLNISLIEEGAPIGYLHDVVHLGARCRAANPLAGGVRLEGPGTQGGPGGPVGGVGLEPPGVCRGGPGHVGGAPRCAGGGQARAPRVGASRGRHGRRHGPSVHAPARERKRGPLGTGPPTSLGRGSAWGVLVNGSPRVLLLYILYYNPFITLSLYILLLLEEGRR